MRLLTHSCLVAAALVAQSVAGAGTIEPAVVDADPQMQVKDGQLDGCGLRLVSFAKSSVGTGKLELLDVSFNLYSNGQAMVKGGLKRATLDASYTPRNPTTVPIASFWIKAPNSRPTVPLGGVVWNSESPPGYLLYPVELEAALSLLFAAADLKELTIAVRIKGEDVDRIHAGTAKMTPEELSSHGQCVLELMDLLLKREGSGGQAPRKP